MKGRSTLEISPNNAKIRAVLRNLEEPYTSIGGRRLLTDSSTQENEAESYITYRSCIPADNEEKLSVLDFEVCLLIFLALFYSETYYLLLFFCLKKKTHHIRSSMFFLAKILGKHFPSHTEFSRLILRLCHLCCNYSGLIENCMSLYRHT